jgi:hypothetical protein
MVGRGEANDSTADNRYVKHRFAALGRNHAVGILSG